MSPDSWARMVTYYDVRAEYILVTAYPKQHNVFLMEAVVFALLIEALNVQIGWVS